MATPIPSIPFTQDAYDKLLQQLKELTQLRQEVVIRLSAAREMGDLSENGAYHAAKFELGNIGRQLRDIRYQLRFGHVVHKTASDVIGFGAVITVESESHQTLTFTLVSEFESDPTAQKLSMKSPMGQAVFGKKLGDVVVVTTPVGEKSYTITKIA